MNQEFRETYPNGSFIGFQVSEWLTSRQSPYQMIDFLRTQSHGVLLALDGLVQLTEADEYVYHEMMAHIPLLVHTDPKQVLIIGGGDGGTAREVCRHASVQHVDMCEIDGMVVELCKQFLPSTAIGMKDTRVKVTIDDGIEFVKQSKDQFYDVIIVDSSDPVGPGVGLFNGAFYQDVYRILKPNGIVVAQGESPLYQLTAVKNLRQAMKAVFPITATYLASIPTYPSGLWSFAFASKSFQPNQFNKSRSEEISKHCKYYNSEVHFASFALPNHIRNEIGENS